MQVLLSKIYIFLFLSIRYLRILEGKALQIVTYKGIIGEFLQTLWTFYGGLMKDHRVKVQVLNISTIVHLFNVLSVDV